MRTRIDYLRISCLAGLLALRSHAGAAATDTNTSTRTIDLPTALRLVEARNHDVQLAREKVNEAQAVYRGSVWQLFPWVSPGIAFRAHEETIQDVLGNIVDVHKHSYAPGATLAVQLDLGEGLYKALAAKQVSRASGYALEAQRQDAVLAAAQGYFDLAAAQGTVRIAEEAVRISSDYEQQIQSAVEAGLAFKGDSLRVRVQTERNRLALRQAIEQQRLVSTRLAQTLCLDPAVELQPVEDELVPLALVETNLAVGSVIAEALASRSELRQAQSLTIAARETRKSTTVGPWIPSLGAQAFFGGLGGGRTGIRDSFGSQEDYLVGFQWRIGPGGLFDKDRQRTADSRLRTVEINAEKAKAETSRQAVDAFTRWQSALAQVETAKRAAVAAEEGFRLARERRDFAVGVVLEAVQAEQDLTRARQDLLRTVADLNKSQYLLRRAVGRL